MDDLTTTEEIIYKQIKNGKTKQNIAEEMYISMHTLKSYISSISKKLKINI